jgi:hypothetical protein
MGVNAGDKRCMTVCDPVAVAVTVINTLTVDDVGAVVDDDDDDDGMVVEVAGDDCSDEGRR